MNKDLKKLQKRMVKDGWTLRTGRRCHVNCKAPDGKTIVVLPHTPGCRYVLHDIYKILRRSNHEYLLDGILNKKFLTI